MESGQDNVHSLVYDKAEIMKQKKNIAGLVSEIALPLAKEFGYDLWDVEYVKEGADMILRITIDTDAEGAQRDSGAIPLRVPASRWSMA